ncbi:MAG: molybdenum cofactor biosynthesis protein MoaE [Bacteroidetes bacterium]|nr:molybdenum cofactor biosynthesis protein MoaE [Bacteroidota bacterium]
MSEKKRKNIFIEGPISPDFIAQSIANHQSKTDVGAHAIFLGQVRADVLNDKTVTAIDYSSYVPMAEEILQEIREAIFAKYPLTCMHIYHSLGRVDVGQISLFVFTSSAHRKEAQDACAELVERLKAEVPVWGKEILNDDSYIWKENK